MTPDLPSALARVAPIETLDLTAAMAGLSPHSARAYQRWIKRYLVEVGGLGRAAFDPRAVPLALVLNTLGAANLKAWLGSLKGARLGSQSIGQARAALVWLAQMAADLERVPYEFPAALSRVKLPRAETGQRAGRWLTPAQIRALLLAAGAIGDNPALQARSVALVSLMAVCGLRRAELTHARRRDLVQRGTSRVLRVHGKGAKLREVKLAAVAARALDTWLALRGPLAPDDFLFTQLRRGGIVTDAPITDRLVYMVVQDAARAAALGPIAPHDLRRSFARGAFEAGASFELIRQSLGHANIATTEHYVNSALELDHAATDIWSDVLVMPETP